MSSTQSTTRYHAVCPACGGFWAKHEDEFEDPPTLRSGDKLDISTLKISHIWATCVRGHRFEAEERIYEVDRGISLRGLEPVE